MWSYNAGGSSSKPVPLFFAYKIYFVLLFLRSVQAKVNRIEIRCRLALASITLIVSFFLVCIFKPNSSRPANSERYLIGCNLKNKSYIKNIRDYLSHLVNRLWELKDDNSLDILEIVPLSMLKSDEVFYSYIVSSNNR